MNGKSSIVRSSREGASPAESVPDERDVKCVRELMSRKQNAAMCGASILIRETAVICVKVELRIAIQLEWNRG